MQKKKKVKKKDRGGASLNANGQASKVADHTILNSASTDSPQRITRRGAKQRSVESLPPTSAKRRGEVRRGEREKGEMGKRKGACVIHIYSTQ